MSAPGPKDFSRRRFALAIATAAATRAAAQNVPGKTIEKDAKRQGPQNATAAATNPVAPRGHIFPEEKKPFEETIVFTRNMIPPRVEAFAMTEVRLRPGVFLEAQEADRGFLKRLDAERLLRNFRINAGIPTNALPLGGWEAPDCELRGHFVGHFLSASALMYAATGDDGVKQKAGYMVGELAKCQQKLGGGYLSAFPAEFFDRLYKREKVWAPFYTIHKIMAGMYDMHQHCGNEQALEVLKGMADWTDHWTAPIPESHMQDILNTEYGGMNEVLYNLAAATGDDRYARVGDRFTKKIFFNPLGLRRDELRGLHANTHIPQVIGAARRYEISGDERFHDVADFFWYEITTARAYVTGGTSNAEHWLVAPRRLGAELKLSAATNECCCAYNMLKLTRHLYQWTGDPRYFDYYERTLFNHRLGAIDTQNGHTQYYLSIVPAAWRTFCTEADSFWCCTGTGTEEFAKLNNSIYFHDGDGLYINLFTPSDLDWKDKGIRLRQETSFPEEPQTTIAIEAATPVRMPIHIRIPHWAGDEAAVYVNNERLQVVPTPRSYLTLERVWRPGDRIRLHLPMYLYAEKMADEPQTQAFLYGPLVLAGKVAGPVDEALIVGPEGPDVRHHPMNVSPLHPGGKEPADWIRPVPGQKLAFRANSGGQEIPMVPYYQSPPERYSIYWTVT
jgi:DUF1680 family protein